MTATRVHFLTLDPGELFRYRESGPVFRRGPDTRDGKATVEVALGSSGVTPDSWRPAGVQEFEDCYVIPIDPEDQETRP